MTSQTKPKICHVSYSRLRHMHDGETCNCRRGRECACKMASGPNIDSKFRDSHITGKYPSLVIVHFNTATPNSTNFASKLFYYVFFNL